MRFVTIGVVKHLLGTASFLIHLYFLPAWCNGYRQPTVYHSMSSQFVIETVDVLAKGKKQYVPQIFDVALISVLRNCSNPRVFYSFQSSS